MMIVFTHFEKQLEIEESLKKQNRSKSTKATSFLFSNWYIVKQTINAFQLLINAFQ